MSLPYSSSIPAEDPAKVQECLKIGPAIRNLLEKDIKPSDILTRKAFENALTLIMVLGGKHMIDNGLVSLFLTNERKYTGSTNAVLHMLAMAKAANVPLTIDDIQAISDKTPFLANLRPRWETFFSFFR